MPPLRSSPQSVEVTYSGSMIRSSSLQNPKPAHRMLDPDLLKAWRDAIKHSEFPILWETREALKLAFKKPYVSHNQLVPIVEADAALCWHLARNATRINPNCREQLTGAVNCLSLLGMQEAIHIAKRLPVVSANETDPLLKHYRQSLLTGYYSALIAQSWFDDSVLGKQYFWATLLAQSALWPWWLSYPNMSTWFSAIIEGKDPWKQLTSLLGQDWGHWQRIPRRSILPDLALALFNAADHPNSSEWMTLRRFNPRTLNKKPKVRAHVKRMEAQFSRSIDPRMIRHKCHSGSVIILTASIVGWLSFLNPNAAKMHRWISIAANTLGISKADIQRRLRSVQRVLKQNSTYIETIGWDITIHTQPRCRFFSPQPTSCVQQSTSFPNENKNNSPNIIDSADVITTAKKTAKKTVNKIVNTSLSASVAISDAKNYIARQPQSNPNLATVSNSAMDSASRQSHYSSDSMDSAGSQKTNESYLNPANAPEFIRPLAEHLCHPSLHDTMRTLMQDLVAGIHSSLNMHHVGLWLLASNHLQLKPAMSENFDMIPMHDVVIELSDNPLVKQILEHESGFIVRNNTQSICRRGLSPALIPTLPEYFMMMRLSIRQNVIGLMVACQHGGREPIGSDTFEQFKRLCLLSSKGLEQLKYSNGTA